MNDVLDSLVARARAAEPQVRPRIDPFVPLAIDDGDTTAMEPPLRSEVDPPPAEAVAADVEASDAQPVPPQHIVRAPEGAATPPAIDRPTERVPHPTIRVVPSERVQREVVNVERADTVPVEPPSTPPAAPAGQPSAIAPPRTPTAPQISVTPVTPLVATQQRPPGPQSSQGPSEPAPTVHVTIGRLEIRATAPAGRNDLRPRPEPPITSLDDYLQQRAEHQ